MLKNYLLTAWRNIARNRTYTFINILGLTLGLCACLVIFLITRHELSFDTFHPDGKYIYRIINQMQDGDSKLSETSVPLPLPHAARNTITGYESIAACRTLSDSAIFTEPSYFSIFKYEWIAGNPATALNSPNCIVLTTAGARKRFGNVLPATIIGHEFLYQDSLRLTVTGIIKDWEGNTDFAYTDFISFSTIPFSFLKDYVHLDDWGGFSIPWTSRAFIKLKKGTNPELTGRQLTDLAKANMHLEANQKATFSLQPLSDIHFNGITQDGRPKASKTTQYILIGIALFILLLAVINFVNLSTALSIRRAKEVGVRKVLGSSRSRLTIQFLIETGTLTFFSMLIAIVLVRPTLHLFHTMIPSNLHFPLLSPDILLFLFLITLITTLLAGLYPARILSSWLPVACLKGGIQKGGEKWWLRKGLIVFQFTVTLIFIISTLIIRRQINYMRNEDLGFSADAIITMETARDDTTHRVRVLAQQLQKLSGVSDIARQSFSPTTPYHTMTTLQYKKKEPIDINSALQIADERFIPLYKMKLLAGINIRPSDGLKEVVINESMMKAMGIKYPKDAIGEKLSMGDNYITIIGVVADFHEYSYRDAILPVIMTDLPVAENGIAIRASTSGKHINDLQNTLKQIGKIWKNIYPETPFKYTFLDEDIARMYEKEEETAFLINAAMIVTAVISCMGLLGLSMFAARQRTKEVGIRKVLGASTADITLLLSRNIIALVLLAVIIASPVAWYCMHLWLQNFVYRADISIWLFALAGLSALAIALLTICFQTIRTALTNPATVLRSE